MAEVTTEFPLQPRMAERLLREAVEDSSKLVNSIRFERDEVWFELVANRQILLCLKEGRVIDKPYQDEHGFWVCRSYRLCAGINVYTWTAIDLAEDGKTVRKVYVFKVENRRT